MAEILYFVTPGGDEMAILPRAELDAIQEAADHARAIADYRSGRIPALTPDETRELIAADSPLAYWRRKSGLTQAALASEVGIAQNYLSDIENGKRSGPVELWLKLSRVLGLPVEALVDEQ
jgi:DNA-binding XRE family transcriptional regulator